MSNAINTFHNADAVQATWEGQLTTHPRSTLGADRRADEKIRQWVASGDPSAPWGRSVVEVSVPGIDAVQLLTRYAENFGAQMPASHTILPGHPKHHIVDPAAEGPSIFVVETRAAPPVRFYLKPLADPSSSPEPEDPAFPHRHQMTLTLTDGTLFDWVIISSETPRTAC
jgi:hypothetical protein